MKAKIAVVLLNMGGPSSLREVEPFLFNLFSDPAIITLPAIFRIPLAKIISLNRVKKAKKIYAKLDGKSPIYGETIKQQQEIIKKLSKEFDIEVFVCMRYAKPNSKEVAQKIKEFDPSKILLLPLYPQFSSTTTASSVKDFLKNYNNSSHKKNLIVKTICCYPTNNKFIEAHTFLLNKHIEQIKDKTNFRVLFSAHSLPMKIIESGDPYQWQIEETVKKIIQNLNIENLDYKITYQSKVGPLKWLTPSTDSEIIEAGKKKKSLVIVPISFVSEHSETLVELDIDYKNLAKNFEIQYIRVPSLSINEIFISSLTEIIENFIKNDKTYKFDNDNGNIFINNRICPANFKLCPNSIINKNLLY